MTALQSILIVSIKTKWINLIFKYSPIVSINNLYSTIYLSVKKLHVILVLSVLAYITVHYHTSLQQTSSFYKKKEKKDLTFGG